MAKKRREALEKQAAVDTAKKFESIVVEDAIATIPSWTIANVSSETFALCSTVGSE